MHISTKQLTFFCVILCLIFSSCRVEKRLYSSGYYINSNSASQKTNHQQSSDKNKSHAKNNFSEQSQKVAPDAKNELRDTLIEENISASCDNKLSLKKVYPSLQRIEEAKSEDRNSSTFKSEFKKGAKRIIGNANTSNASMNGFALAGFICSLVGLILFGLILGVVAIILSAIGLSKINKDPLGWNGRGFAIAGIIIGILDIIGWIIFLALFL